MSVFRGSISEYPGVIVDHFVPANCERGRVFFLSHCHRDHMTGLGSPNIVVALKKWKTNLLCSEVTRSLLLNDPEFTQLAPYLRGLPMDDPIAMSLEPSAAAHEKLSFTVTLLPAGHCPGSSMFFFQGCRGNVLYTGDFRLTLEETKRLRSLHSGGSLLEISTLYVDTTFYHPIATEIPSRDTSRDIVLNLVESWLAEDPANVVHLQCASFGYEHIFMAISKKFKTKIHTVLWKMKAYQDICAVTDCLTIDGDSTNIHACIPQRGQKGVPGLPCRSCQRNGAPPNVLTIKPSTQWFLFNRKTTTQPSVFLPRFNKYRVIHSMHASFSELKEFIAYIRPCRIVPCVIPFGDSSLADVCARLKELLPHTEVSSGCVEPKERQRPVKRKQKLAGSSTETAGNLAESSDDGWSTGDESIDEFPSTKEPGSSLEGETAVFTHSQSHNFPRIALPSLIATEDTRSTTPPPSIDSGATLGSLIQSPIDLSLSPRLVSSSSQSSLKDTFPPTEPNTSRRKCSEHHSQGIDSVKAKLKSTNDNLSCDSVENGSLQSSFEVSTPPSKRVRLSHESSPLPCKLFTEETNDFEQRVEDEEEEEEKDEEENEEDEDDEEDEIVGLSPSNHSFIDLTEDELDETLVASERAPMIDLTCDHLTPPPELDLTNKHSSSTADDHGVLPSNSRLSSPILLSDSQSSSSVTNSVCTAHSRRSASVDSSGVELVGSPNCLPPTPGRENVHSILRRLEFP